MAQVAVNFAAQRWIFQVASHEACLHRPANVQECVMHPALPMCQECLNLRARTHDREPPRALGSWKRAARRQVAVQNLAIQQQHGAHGNIVSRGRALLVDRQRGHGGADRVSAYGGGMLFVVEQDEARAALARGGCGTGAAVCAAGERADRFAERAGGHGTRLAVGGPLLLSAGRTAQRARLVAWRRPGARQRPNGSTSPSGVLPPRVTTQDRLAHNAAGCGTSAEGWSYADQRQKKEFGDLMLSITATYHPIH